MSNYFDGVEVGDKLWSMMYGEVEVISIKENGRGFPIACKAPNGDIPTFSVEGTWTDGQLQTLFWSKPEFEIPQRPKKWQLKGVAINPMPAPYVAYTHHFKDISITATRTSEKQIRNISLSYEVEE